MDNQHTGEVSFPAMETRHSPDPRRTSTGTLGRGSIRVLAAACGVAVANANYAQPLLVDIARSFGPSDATVGLIPLRRRLDPAPMPNRTAYAALMRSLAQVFLSVGVVRWSALCQALSTGSFTVLWIAISFHMQSPEFGWHSDGVGALGLIGAAAVVFAPLVGRIADRRGPRLSLLLALTATSLAWVLLAAFGHSVAGVIVGMILLDLGATSADISNRTVIFSLYPEIRTRLTTIYMVGKFAGAGAMAWLTGIVWSLGGWPAVCALGGGSAVAAAVVAWAGVGRPSRSPRM
jgi:predicted MFS family arabinose efflux permease